MIDQKIIYKQIFFSSKFNDKENKTAEVDSKKFLKYLSYNNVFMDFILSKYFNKSANDRMLIQKITNEYYRYKLKRKKAHKRLNELLSKNKIKYIEIKNDIFLKKIHSDIDILIEKKDFKKLITLKKDIKYEKFLHFKQRSKIEIKSDKYLDIEIIHAFQWSRKIKLDYSKFFLKRDNNAELIHYLTTFVELIYKKVFFDLSDAFSLKKFNLKYKASIFKIYFENIEDFIFFRKQISLYTKKCLQLGVELPNYELKNIYILMKHEIKTKNIDFIFYAYHIFCFIRFKLFNKLPFYQRQNSNIDNIINKKFYYFKL